MVINNKNLNKFEDELEETVKDLAKKWGLEITVGGARYDEESFSVTLKANNIGSQEKLANKYIELYGDRYRGLYIGTKFFYKNHTYTIAAINPNKKFDLDCKRDDNTLYCFRAEAVKEFLNN